MDNGHTQNHGHTKRAVRATLWAVVDTLIPLFTGLGVFIFTSHMLTPSQFGIVALATGLSYLGSALCPGGFGEAIVQRFDLKPQHLSTVFWLCIFCSVIVYLATCGLAPTAARFFKIPLLAVFIPVISIRIIADMAAVVPNALIMRAMAFNLSAFRTLCVTLLASLFSIVLLLKGYGMWALVVSGMMSSFVNMVATFLASKWRPSFSFSFAALKELAGYGFYSTGTQNVSQVFTQNEQILVGYFLGTAQLGFYNFSKRVIAVFNSVVSGSLGAVAHPMFSGIQNDRDRVRRGFLMATFVSSLLAFPIFIGLAFVSDRVIPLVFGERWVEAVILVKIQCALGLIACIGGLQAGLITSQGKANWWFYYQLLSMAGTAAAIAIFARYGLPVMMTAMLIKTYCFWFIPVRNCLILLSMTAKDYFLNFRAPLLASIFMGLSIFCERRLLAGTGNLTGLAADIISGGLAYAIVIYLWERKRLFTLLHLVLPRLSRQRPLPQ